MEEKNDQLNALTEMRAMMERSVRFLSLSGFSGVVVGIIALAGAIAAYLYYEVGLFSPFPYKIFFSNRIDSNSLFFFIDVISVLFLSLLIITLLTRRKAKRRNLPVWSPAASRMLVNLLLPLAAGGILSLIMLAHSFFLIALLPAITLIFYGLALINASRYTFGEVWYLGLTEILIGLLAAAFPGFGLLFWAFGFGIIHILYGIIMFRKYDMPAKA
jgi:hypothetical protein